MRFITACLSAVLCSGCMGPDCANEVIEQTISPDGDRKLVLFSRNCGATTGSNVQGMLLNRQEKMPEDGGNIFIVDHGSAKASWTSDRGIVVTFDPGVRIYKQETSVLGISIEYRNTPGY